VSNSHIAVALTHSPYSGEREGLFGLLDLFVDQSASLRVYLMGDGVLAAKEGSQLQDVISELTQKGVVFLAEKKELNARGLRNTFRNLRVTDDLVSEFVDDLMKEDWKALVI
jgi:sulfur relay protein TusB/DsrH